MQNPCRILLSTQGQDQILIIPHEFALSGTEVLLRKEGNCLIVEPAPTGSLLSVLSELEEIAENFPNVDDGLPALDNITI